MPTSAPARSMTASRSDAENPSSVSSFGCGGLTRPRPASAVRGLRRHASGCAPRNAALMKLLSRCAGNTRAAPAAGVWRARRTSPSMRPSASGAHATVVGQNAVTPYRGSLAAIAATGLPPSSRSSVSNAFDAVHVDVDEAGDDVMMMKRRTLESPRRRIPGALPRCDRLR